MHPTALMLRCRLWCLLLLVLLLRCWLSCNWRRCCCTVLLLSTLPLPFLLTIIMLTPFLLLVVLLQVR